MKKPTPLRIAFAAIMLVVLGFVLGIGYQTLQYAALQSTPRVAPTPSETVEKKRAPVVRGLRVSPDDRLLAFTAIYNANDGSGQLAGRMVFDLESYLWNETPSPRGWQDSITQWSSDGRSLLWSRAKLPRPVAAAQSGLFGEKVFLQPKGKDAKAPQVGDPKLLTGSEPPGEKPYAGFWTPKDKLVVKTRRETKALFLENGDVSLLDRSPGTYYQNRAATENGKTVYYVVRDVSVEKNTIGLFRLDGGKSKQLGADFGGVVWAYLSDDVKNIIICSSAPNGRDWLWSLYRVSPSGLKFVKKNEIPADAIAVYWSPNGKQVLGAAGKSLWLISIPSLRVLKLGDRDDWNADDAAWLNHSNELVIAAQGQLWRVDAATGARREFWKFPNEYWN